MKKKLSWQEIEKLYNKEWVQLIDYDWPEGTPFPVAGVVRVHSSDRKDFYRKVKENHPKSTDSAFVFVGVPEKDPNTIYNNFHKTMS